MELPGCGYSSTAKVSRLPVVRERLMCQLGVSGAVRGRNPQTTIPDEAVARPANLVQRDFAATRRTSCGWRI